MIKTKYVHAYVQDQNAGQNHCTNTANKSLKLWQSSGIRDYQ